MNNHADGLWWWSDLHRQPVRVLEWRQLWDTTVATVWLPGQQGVATLNAELLRPLDAAHAPVSATLGWRAAAVRIAEALSQGVLLAPLEGTVIPLPHQLKVLARALSQDVIRYLLADEVGLGKTIEAGLILRELKLQGRVQRILILAPKGLVSQWVQEMQNRFQETFRMVLPSDIPTLRRLGSVAQTGDEHEGQESNPWSPLSQVVCPMDSFKPLERRRGWTQEQVTAYNRERLGLLLEAGWDLIIVDEAHRLGGSTDEVARYRLGEALSQAAPYLLLLSATPHQGKTDSFVRLMRLLDRGAFPEGTAPDPGRVAPYIIRTEKRQAIDAEGNPLFRPRRTRLCPVSWSGHLGVSPQQQHLYEAVTEYVREGYNRALAERRYALGFLMILMQRLVTSSTRAIRTALERRLIKLEERDTSPQEEMLDLEDPEADVQTLLDEALETVPPGQHERLEVDRLLILARQVEAEGSDAKALTLLELLRGFQQAEENPELKCLIFTEFIPTQEMLEAFLTAHGYRVVCLHGSLSMLERQEVQAAFAGPAQILLSTDAGGEGLNLQFCHVVINFDLPWNPMRIEQRIGRVDRIGQAHEVTAVNLVLEDSVEFRVREVLESKLAIILAEFGVDKTSDVLESVEAGAAFDQLYAEVVVNPAQAGARLEALLAEVRARAASLRTQARLLEGSDDAHKPLDPEAARTVLHHPLPSWVEKLVLGYLADAGGSWTEHDGIYTLIWPDGHVQQGVFSPAEAIRRGLRLISIQDVRVRRLALELPEWGGLPIPCTDWPGLSASVQGIFAVFRVELLPEAMARGAGKRTVSIRTSAIRTAAARQTLRVLPLFVHSDGRLLGSTARHILDRLMQAPPPITRYLDRDETSRVESQLMEIATAQGHELYQELLSVAQSGPTQRGAGNRGAGAGVPRLDPLLMLKIRGNGT